MISFALIRPCDAGKSEVHFTCSVTLYTRNPIWLKLKYGRFDTGTLLVISGLESSDVRLILVSLSYRAKLCLDRRQADPGGTPTAKNIKAESLVRAHQPMGRR